MGMTALYAWGRSYAAFRSGVAPWWWGRGAILVLLYFVGLETGSAQIRLNYVSANAGVMRTLGENMYATGEDRYVFYPEIQCGGDLFLPYLRWVGYWGYADEGHTMIPPPEYHPPYTYRTHSVGIRFSFMPAHLLPHWPIPVGLFIGISRQFISVSGEYPTFMTSQGPTGRPAPRNVTAFEAGVNLEIRVYGRVGIRIEGHQLILLGITESDRMDKNRRAFTGGLGWTF
jgi:hypothetical protein